MKKLILLANSDNYLLLKGDCRRYLSKIDDNYVDMVLTDPPYGDNYISNKQLGNTRKGFTETTRNKHYFDKIENDDGVITGWFHDVFRVLKNDGAFYCFCKWKTYSEFEKWIKNAGFIIKNMIVVNKSNHGMGDLKGQYAPKHELIIFAVKGRHLLNRIKGRRKDVWNMKVKFSGSHRYHPNEKPIGWFRIPILESSKKNDIIFDPFMGSGSVGVASLKYGRRFLGIELNKDYWQTSVDRISSIKI